MSLYYKNVSDYNILFDTTLHIFTLSNLNVKRKSLHVTIPENLIEMIEQKLHPGQSKSQFVEEIIRTYFDYENEDMIENLQKEVAQLQKRVDQLEAIISGLLQLKQ